MITGISLAIVTLLAAITYRNIRKHKAEQRDMQDNIARLMHAENLSAWKYDINRRQIIFFDNTFSPKKEVSLEHTLTRHHPDDVQPFIALIDQMLLEDAPDEASIAIRVSNDEGTYTNYQCKLQRVCGLHGEVKHLLGVHKKIVPLKDSEEAWKEGMTSLAYILDNIPIPIHIKDADTYRFVYWNKASTHMFGVDAIGQTIETVVDKETADAIHAIDKLVFETKLPYCERETIITHSGHTYETIVHKGAVTNKVRKLIITARIDIGETLLLQHQLEKAYQQGELIINNSNSSLAYITSDYIVQWENFSSMALGAIYELYKKGEPCYKSAYGRSEPCENCVMQRAMLSKKVEQIEQQLENGTSLEIFATPIFNHKNEVEGVVIRAENNTERKEIIEALKKAKEKAEESDQLKSAFLANMSHEIRTPLNAIVGFSSLLAEEENIEMKREYNHIISLNNDLLLQLISDILDLSKIESGTLSLTPTTFDLMQTLEEIAASQRYRVRSGVDFILVQPYQSCLVTLDVNKLTQVVTNFIVNAIKFTSTGSITLSSEQKNGGICINVTDTGIGISEENLPRIFNRFEKLDSFVQGTGLGLPICQAIIEAHGGKLEVTSVPGKGSTFSAWFPCTPILTAKTNV